MDEARRNLATIAQAIARFEPVVMCVRPEESKLAKSFFKEMKNIDWFECPLDDLWIRDSGPVFVIDKSGKKSAVDFNFNGWGEKQDYDNDSELATTIANDVSDVPIIETDICLEGGGIEVDDYAKSKLKEHFPGREIVMLNIDGIAAGGGGIHCATQQEPIG